MEIPHKDDVELIELLMSANMTRDGWQVFLDKLTTHFNLNTCNLYMVNANTQSIRFQDWSGIKPSEIQLNRYFEEYFSTDKVHMQMLSGPAGKWLTPNLMPNRDELESTRAYIEWAKPNNFIYSTGTVLFRKGSSICAMHFNRNGEQPPFTQEEEDRFSILAPYISKAVALRLHIAESCGNNYRIKALLDTFRFPVAVLNEFGELISVNTPMDVLLHNNTTIKINEENRLVLTSTKEDAALQLSVTASVSIAKNRDLDYSRKSISFCDTNGDSRFSVGTCELVEKDKDTGDIFVGAMVYVISKHIMKSISKPQLKTVFSFTEAEAQCCHLFGGNMSLKEIAKHEDKSVHTVKEQIKNCYVKTGTKNQLELINLISSLPLCLNAQ